jgi:hypothetical protein
MKDTEQQKKELTDRLTERFPCLEASFPNTIAWVVHNSVIVSATMDHELFIDPSTIRALADAENSLRSLGGPRGTVMFLSPLQVKNLEALLGKVPLEKGALNDDLRKALQNFFIAIDRIRISGALG